MAVGALYLCVGTETTYVQAEGRAEGSFYLKPLLNCQQQVKALANVLLLICWQIQKSPRVHHGYYSGGSGESTAP